MNQGLLGTGSTLSTRATETPEAAGWEHDRAQDGDPQTSGLKAPAPGRIGSNIPDLDDLERRILRSQRPAKTRENRQDRVPPAIPKDQPPEILIAHCPEAVLTIFHKIGVSLWLGWRNFTTLTIVMMGLFYIVLTVMSYILGLQQAGEQWTALSLLLFSAAAIILLQLVKRSIYSADLHMVLQKQDEFVQDCGQGLDWASVARKYWCHFVFLWALASLEFIVQQVLEETAKDTHTSLSILQAIASCFLFWISSAVVMSGVYLQFNLLLGVGKALDCWCADIAETQDFVSGVQTWNSLQAWLKCVGREITPCFTSVILLGYVGFFVAITGCIVVLLADGLEVWRVLLYASSLLPLLYLCYLSVRLFAQGASLSERCKQIPAFVNQLSMRHDGADTDRKYLVQYISNSAAGFIVHGVTLSQSVLVEQMFWVAAVCSGIMGVLLRRYP